MESRIEMSQRERDILKIMSAVLQGKRTQSEAARLLQVSVRQVRRIQRRLEDEGDRGVVHRLRGRPSNRQFGGELREQVLDVYQRELSDFGPTLASEVLEERGLSVSADTLRRWLMASGLWKRERRRDQHRSRRPRRECFGELVQMDASIHDWLEGRGEEMVLVTMIDDATNRFLARFYDGETVEAYFDIVGRWLAKYGRWRSTRITTASSKQRPRGRRSEEQPNSAGPLPNLGSS
jgi:transposase